MQVLVTGGTGFVGSHLIERLRQRGDDVRALVRPASRADFVRSLGAAVVEGDLDDWASLRNACRGREIVYHSAARVEIVGKYSEFQKTTVDGTRRLVNAANEAGVRRFVFVSSCGIYHPKLLAAGAVIDESTVSPPPPKWFSYARAKYQAENIVRRDARPPMEWVIVRLGYLYGPRNRTMHSYLEPVMRDDVMMLVGSGENEMALVYVEDAVDAIALAGMNPEAAGRVLIVAGNERITQRQYFNALAGGFGLPPVTKSVPYRVAYFFGWLGEKWIHRGPRAAVMRRSAIALTGLPQRIRCERTQALLGWAPRVTFAEGMRKACEWYHAEYGPSADGAAAGRGLRDEIDFAAKAVGDGDQAGR
jgi:nucleoside-diphosphate-sugar epimerase